MSLDDLYQEVILDHMAHPRNFGTLENLANVINVQKIHMGCGDSVNLQMQLSAEHDRVELVRWQGKGCAISMAAMSMLSEFIEKKLVAEILQLDKAKLLELLGLEEITPAREDCLLLSLQAVQQALKER